MKLSAVRQFYLTGYKRRTEKFCYGKQSIGQFTQMKTVQKDLEP